MDALSSTGNNVQGPQMYALKQATKVQEEMVTKLLDTLQGQMQTNTQSVSGLAEQGIGQKLDIKG